jgi:hypothetical protein
MPRNLPLCPDNENCYKSKLIALPCSVNVRFIAKVHGVMHMNSKLIIAGIMAGVIAATITGAVVSFGNTNLATAQMSGGHMMDSGSMGGMMEGSGGQTGAGSMMTQNYPGSIHEQCGGSMGNMPPHYCEPIYKTMSSVKGIRVSAVEPMGDKSLMVTLQQISSMADATTERVIVVGGSGDLAGGVVVDAGWDGTTTVDLNLTGTGSIYDHHGGLSIHLFPYTG